MFVMPACGRERADVKIGERRRAQVGTTPRTIRYYEEIGLLPGADEREAGRHRVYDERDIERLQRRPAPQGAARASLEELKTVLEAEEARAALRDEWHEGNPIPRAAREILDEALGHLERQLELVRRRRAEIDRARGRARRRAGERVPHAARGAAAPLA